LFRLVGKVKAFRDVTVRWLPGLITCRHIPFFADVLTVETPPGIINIGCVFAITSKKAMSNSSHQQGTDPIDNKEDVRRNPDPKIDQDFPGFPGGPADDKKVNPDTPAEKKSADVGNRDGEKKLDADKDNAAYDEGDSDGSANAFDRTEPRAKEGPVKKRRSDGSANAFERTEGSPLNDEDEEENKTYY
jgi:hypothetical protein